MATDKNLICFCDIVGDEVLQQSLGEEKLDQKWKAVPVTDGKKKKHQQPSEKKKRKAVGKMRETLVKNYAAGQSRQGTNSLEDIEAEMRNLYLPGQSRTLDSPEEMSKDLLQRDANHLANFDGKLPIGATIIPQTYVPKNPRIVQPERKDEVSVYLNDHFTDEKSFKKFKGELESAEGDLPEKEAYEVIREYYNDNHDKRTALVVKDLHMLQPNLEKRSGKDTQEIDSVIVDYDSETIIMIEEKKTLTMEHHNSCQKSRDQLKEYKKFFEEWFSSDICELWKVKRFVYCQNIDPNLVLHEDCNMIILCGKEALREMLEQVNNTPPKNVDHPCLLDEFKLICRYLIFCVSAVPLPTKGNLPKLVREALAKAGSAKNIKLWCFLTPSQMETLQKSHLVFVACWGTGKTLLMLTRAIELNNLGEKVLFLVFVDGSKIKKNQKTLLMLDLEEKFKDCDNVDVKGIRYLDGKEMIDIEGNNLSKISP